MKDYYTELQKINFTLLGITSSNKGTQMFEFRCPNNHIEKLSKIRWDANPRCRSCLEIQKFKELAEKDKYEFCSLEKTNRGSRLHLLCPNNHKYSTSVGNWNQGYRCRECNQPSYNIEKARALFEKEGYQLLSTEYVNAHTKLSFKCTKDHIYQMSLNTWNTGTRCGMCDKNYLPKNVKELLKQQDIELLSTPLNACDRMHIKWPCGHEKKVMYYEFIKEGNDCKTCIRNKEEAERVVNYIVSFDYKVEDFNYKNAHEHLTLVCLKEHKFKITWTNFQQGHRCPTCMNRISTQQLEIAGIYRALGIEVKDNDRKILYPKELDVLFPHHKVAIEYCGLYWHSDQRDNMTSSYHYDKMTECNKKGIRLITIFEDEWLNNKDVCLSRINHALKVNNKKIYARKCEIKQISSKEAYGFLDKFHLQKSGKASICFGLFHEGNLLQVMTGGSPNRQHTSKGIKTLEIKRLASHSEYNVVGGAGKLLKALKEFSIQQGYEQIKSYCDMRWGTGELYKQLGFHLTHTTKYTPHYIKGNKRVRNQTLKKPKDSTSLTEKELRMREGYSIIYDCGHQTWSFDLKNNINNLINLKGDILHGS